jgi:hypothetical protein
LSIGVTPLSGFAKPIYSVPTQILAETFKAEGFDGVAYRSGLERGTNIVLFDARVAKPTHRFVYTL